VTEIVQETEEKVKEAWETTKTVLIIAGVAAGSIILLVGGVKLYRFLKHEEKK
jgi:uncharacterized membrane protein